MKTGNHLWRARSVYFLATTAIACGLPARAGDLPADARVADLVGRMTLEEKAAQVVNTVQANPRLGLPPYNWWSEALHGVAFRGRATVFPEPIGLGASFDPTVVHRMGEVIATEQRAKSDLAIPAGDQLIPFTGLSVFAPNINIFRDPRWGRGQETYGEDPYLTSRMGVAFIEGVQGDDPAHMRIAATAKHYAVHSGPEPLRHVFDARPSPHDLADTYLPAFRAAVTEAHVASVMCVYNSVNGEPGCANQLLDVETLRRDWGFSGQLVSDCDAMRDISRNHHFVATEEEGAAVAFRRGLDLVCQDSPHVEQVVAGAVRNGVLDEAELTRAVTRNLTLFARLGGLDRAPDPDAGARIDTPDARALAAEAARKTMTLLKNDGVLPLAASVRRIAVVGPLADDPRVMYGNYNGTPAHGPTALEAIRAEFPHAQIEYAPGPDLPLNFLPLSTAALRTPSGEPGLQGELFDAPTPGGPVQMRWVEPADQPIESSWPTPPRDVPRSIRWTGTLTPRESGTYDFGVIAAHARLAVDGKTLVDDAAAHPYRRSVGTATLEAGRPYTLVAEMDASEDDGFNLVWQLHSPPGSTDRAVAVARTADVVVAVVGITSQLEGEESDIDIPGFKGGDRTTLGLPEDEQRLLEAVKETGKPLVVVLANGGPLSVGWAAEHANAILEAWYSGQSGGIAVAQTLSGANNPAGRLPVTVYTDTGQLPDFADYAMDNRTYRYFNGTPLYPFGFGLSYSSFAYSDLAVSAGQVRGGDALDVSVQVAETAGRAGDEVVQLYVDFPTTPGRRSRALRAFQRIGLAAHEQRTVRFHLDADALSSVDAQGARRVVAGEHRISVGGGQPGPGSAALTRAVTVTD